MTNVQCFLITIIIIIIISLSVDCMGKKSHNHADLARLSLPEHIDRIAWQPDLIGQVAGVQTSLCLMGEREISTVNNWWVTKNNSWDEKNKMSCGMWVWKVLILIELNFYYALPA